MTPLKHFFMGVFAVALFVLAGFIVVENVKALTTLHLIFAGACVVVAGFLAFGTDFGQAVDGAAKLVPLVRKGESS